MPAQRFGQRLKQLEHFRRGVLDVVDDEHRGRTLVMAARTARWPSGSLPARALLARPSMARMTSGTSVADAAAIGHSSGAAPSAAACSMISWNGR